MIWYLVGAIVFLCLLHVLLNCNKRARMIYKVPGPKKYFIFANLFTIIKSPVEFMRLGREFAETYKNIHSFWAYPYGMVIIYNPEDVEKILSSIKYADKSIVYTFLKPWLGEGLLISNGTKWQERRKILTPAFHFNILKQFFEIIKENSDLLIENLNSTVGTSIDVLPALSEFTLNTICETAMGTKLKEDATGAAKSYKAAIQDLIALFVHRFMRVYLFPEFMFNLSSIGRAQQKYLKTVHRFTKTIVDQRQDYIETNSINDIVDINNDLCVYEKKKRAAMLDLLILAHKDGLIDRNGIQEEVDTFMFEGHDTTATGLTFCLMILANHREVQDKIYDELIEIFGDTKRPIQIEDLNQMKYMECCIKESLRLYPPVHFISRSLNETTVLSNYTLPAGTLCHIVINHLHCSESIYKNPYKFDPDRFLPENSVGRHPYAYIPFSAGPRNCIGQKFAMMEMKIVLARILRDFILLPVTRPEDICFTADIILRNNGPVLVKFVKRNSN